MQPALPLHLCLMPRIALLFSSSHAFRDCRVLVNSTKISVKFENFGGKESHLGGHD